MSSVGGEAGIRTLGRGLCPYNGLANRRLQPLGHLTAGGPPDGDPSASHYHILAAATGTPHQSSLGDSPGEASLSTGEVEGSTDEAARAVGATGIAALARAAGAVATAVFFENRRFA